MQTETNDLRYYLGILKTRKTCFIIPALIILLVASAVALLLPTIYESSSTILIEEQQIPPEFVRSTVTGFADQRIQSLTQQILSRTKLWEITQQFNLYQELRATYTREEILDEMRDNIHLNTISAEQKGGKGVTIAFSVAYRGKSPDMVQKVSGTLASLYLEQNLKMREDQARSTTKFLEAELKELEERIRTLGEKITAFKEQYEGLLPDQQQFNMSRAESLETDIKQLDNKIRAAEELKTILGGQLATAKLTTSALDARAPGGTSDPYSRLKALEVNLADLRSKYSEDHPDIRKTLREIAELKKIVGDKGTNSTSQREKLAQLKVELAEKQGKYSDNHPDIRKVKNEIGALEKDQGNGSSSPKPSDQEGPADINFSAQIQAADTEIEADKRQQAFLLKQLQMYRKRLEEAPKVEQEYLALQRDYQNDSQKHQEVMNKILESRISEGMEEHQKAEKFTLIDPASAGKVVSPPRLLIFLAGIILSFGGGFGTVALVEHLDHSVKTADELSMLTNFPVLGSIPRIQTSEDVTRDARRKRLIWMGTAVSVIMGLALLNFFYQNLLVLAGRLLRQV
jgi:uncharacterized protein involved in exopolysaccharide biosynthesis